MKLLMKTGPFERKYKEWHTRADGDKTWTDFKQFWPAKVQSKQRTQRTARQFGFGGMSIQDQASMQEGVNDFANTHAHTVATVSGLQQQNAQMQQVLPEIQQQMANLSLQLNAMQMANAANTTQGGAPPPQYNTYNYRGRGGG